MFHAMLASSTIPHYILSSYIYTYKSPPFHYIYTGNRKQTNKQRKKENTNKSPYFYYAYCSL
jgi:hypothetical protein